MFKFKCFIPLVVSVSFNFSFVAAQEHGGAAPPPAEHGGGATATPKEKEFSGQQNEKWSEVQLALTALKTKVDAQSNLVKDLLAAKKHNEGKISQDEIETLKKEHEKLQSLTKDYNEMLADFQFRFPEKGLEAGRKYIRLENQSLDDMENSPTIEGRLKKLTQKIKKQYQAEGVTAAEKNTHSSHKAQHSIKKIESKTINEPEVTDQIIFVK